MFENIIIGILVLFVNMSIGATVLTLMDNDEGAIQAWFDRCPTWCAWFMKPLILNSWFIWLIPFIKGIRSGYK
jgi:hypothetical protein